MSRSTPPVLLGRPRRERRASAPCRPVLQDGTPAAHGVTVAAGLLLAALLLTGCPARRSTDQEAPNGSLSGARRSTEQGTGAFADTSDPWVLKTTDPNANRGNHGIFLGNGYIGATFSANGGAGRDARAYVAGLYDEKETLKPLPNWHDLGLPEPKPGDKYEQTLDMKRGVLTTKAGGVTVTSLISAVSPHHAILHVEGVKAPAPGPAVPTKAGNLVIASEMKAEADGAWDRITSVFPANAVLDYKTPADYKGWLTAQEKAWGERWQGADIVIEGDPEAQQLVHKLMFDLLQSARPGGDDSIPPETLSGDFYKGHIFWDAEVWMFPALLAQHPDLARTILDYRYKHLDQAKAQASKQGCKGADFPWESAASGKETAPGGFSEGRHVTAGVGWAVWQYYLATSDKKWLAERGWPLLSNVADYFATRAKKNPTTGKYDIKGVTGPDEFALKATNNTYTNAMARNCLNDAAEAAKVVGKPTNPQWKVVAEGLALPFDKGKGVYLKVEGDDGKPGVKQADGELILYPAELPMDAKTAAATFDFHKGRVIKNGPAMTDSIHALIAARLGRSEEAEKYFRDSYRPFVRGPFLLFSEKRSLDRCVFTTGAGGVLQSVLYGFGGLDYSSSDGLVKGPVALPPSWKKLTITGVHRGGKRYTLTVTPQGRMLTPQAD